MLKDFVAGRELFSFELNELLADGLVEAVWCKDGSNPDGQAECFRQISRMKLTCHHWLGINVAKKKGCFSPLSGGVIPAKYLKACNERKISVSLLCI